MERIRSDALNVIRYRHARQPIVIATSDQSITGRARATMFGWRVQVTQDGDVYKLELVASGGFHLFVR